MPTFTQQQLSLAKTVPKGSAGYYELIRQGYDPAIVGSEYTPRTDNKPADYIPTPQDKATERIARYNVTGEEDPLAKFTKQYYEGLSKTPLTAEEQQRIREETRARMQAQIDAVNEVYNKLITREEGEGKGRIGQTRAIAARSGTLGSDFGEQALGETAKKNKEIIESIQAERGLKMQGLFQEIDASAEKEIKARQEEAQGNAKAYINFLSGVRDEQRTRIKDLAQAGMLSLDELSEEQYQSLLTQTGYTPLELESVFESNKPKATKIDFSEPKVFEGPDGDAFLMRYGIDPATGEVKTQQGSLGIPYSQYQGAGKPEIRESKGEFYMFDSKTNTMQKIGGERTPEQPTEKEKSQTAVKSMASQLNTVTGQDGFISPDDYKKAKQAWVGEGFSAKDFDDNFNSYRNPFRPSEDYGIQSK